MYDDTEADKCDCWKGLLIIAIVATVAAGFIYVVVHDEWVVPADEISNLSVVEKQYAERISGPIRYKDLTLIRERIKNDEERNKQQAAIQTF